MLAQTDPSTCSQVLLMGATGSLLHCRGASPATAQVLTATGTEVPVFTALCTVTQG